jgi:integrase
VLLGEHDSPASRIAYAEAIASWERDGRVLDNATPQPVKATDGVTVAEVMLDWWEGVLQQYGVTDPTGRLPAHLYSQRSVVRLTRATCGAMPAAKFGPLALQEVRQAMVGKGWSRGHVNTCVAVIIRAFKQAVAREVVTAASVVALQCLKPLTRGEQGAPEGEKVLPVPLADVVAVKPYLSRQAVAIIDVMLLTGARCCEVTIMRPVDIEAGKVWTFKPTHHKSEHHGRERLIHIGPRAQAIVEQFMAGRPLDAYLFSPAEAEAERRAAQHAARVTPLSCGNRPGKRLTDPKRQAGDHYTTESLRRAISRACKAAGVEAWSPHQLRHTAATELRRAAGVEAASIILGHSSATLTDRVYAERDHLKAADIIGRVG